LVILKSGDGCCIGFVLFSLSLDSTFHPLSFDRKFKFPISLQAIDIMESTLYNVLMQKFEYNDKLINLIWDKLQALANPIRLKILLALKEKPMCVCELSEYLGDRQPLISQHLAILKDSDLVIAKRMGTRIQYSLSDNKIIELIDIIKELTIKKIEELTTLKEE